MYRPARPGFPVPMTYPDIRAVLGRERQNTLLADGMSAGMRPAVSWLSFPRIIDVPFETCMAVLESWQRTGQDSELHIGRSLLRWPIEQGRDRCARRIEVGLTRGPLRPPRRMRLDISCWSPSSARTVLELIPRQRVRPTAAYFRSGHLLLDSLTHSLLRHSPAEQLDS
jgi:hypothetical protein